MCPSRFTSISSSTKCSRNRNQRPTIDLLIHRRRGTSQTAGRITAAWRTFLIPRPRLIWRNSTWALKFNDERSPLMRRLLRSCNQPRFIWRNWRSNERNYWIFSRRTQNESPRRLSKRWLLWLPIAAERKLKARICRWSFRRPQSLFNRRPWRSIW